MMVMLDETETLRPYPIDPSQDDIVRRVLHLKEHGPISRTKACFSNLGRRISRSVSRFFERFRTPEEEETKVAKEITPLPVCTRTNAMDSKFYYAILDGRLWFKPIAAHKDSPWRLFGKNGFCDKRHTRLVLVSADGDNVITIDENRTIHYAKSNNVVCQISFDCPEWKITESDVKWKQKWFSMDGVSLIVNLFKDPILQPIPNARSIAISHKGPDTMYYTDMNGKKHPDPYIGVTTIYALNEDGTKIYFADPWLYNKFLNEITGPEEGQFKAETLAASGSTIMLLQRARDQNGEEIQKIYTRFADFDNIGSNPALKATYNQNNHIPLIRYLPPEDWILQPCIPLSGKARLTKNISVLQIGWGQNNRELRVQAQNENSRNGYYYKNIYNNVWNFQGTEDIMIEDDEFLSRSVPYSGFEQGPKIVEDYLNGIIVYPTIDMPVEMTLEKFSRQGLNERGLHTKLVFSFQNDFKLSIPLYAKRGWKSLLGISSKNIWILVIPPEYFERTDQVQLFLRRVFRNRRKHPVNVYEQGNAIRITNEFGTCCRFSFFFRDKLL